MKITRLVTKKLGGAVLGCFFFFNDLYFCRDKWPLCLFHNEMAQKKKMLRKNICFLLVGIQLQLGACLNSEIDDDKINTSVLVSPIFFLVADSHLAEHNEDNLT